MKLIRIARGMAAAGLLAAVACHSLEVDNPNAPDNLKLLADPNAIEAIGAGSIRGWYNAYQGMEGGGPLSTMARTYTASWNNAHMRFYSSIDNPGIPLLDANGNTTGYTPTATWHRGDAATSTTGEPFGTWQNDPNRVERQQVEWYWSGGGDENTGATWPGYYGGLSSANDVLKAIRKSGLVIRSAADTKRAEIIAMLGRGLALYGLSTIYDSAFVLDENTKLDTLKAYSNRKVVRDAAVAQFQAVIDSANKYTFTTDAKWANGPAYTNVQIKQFASTMAALTLAYYPRDPGEVTTQVAWATVLSYAQNGISSGTAFDFVAVGDGCTAWCPEIGAGWFQDIGGGRVSTRVAYLMDPATQMDPWPLSGNPKPNSLDRRLGDGTFGDGSSAGSSRETPIKDAGAGTDFAWSPKAPFRPSRGQYHQSNIAHIRYDLSGNQSGNAINGGFGPYPAVTATQNDLIWAEALLQVGGAVNLLQAATLINKTHVTRGGLPAASVADGVGARTDGPCMATNKLATNGGACTLWSKLLYEKELELLGLGPSPFYEQRRLPWVATCGLVFPCNGRHVQGLIPGTPFEMPVPDNELQVSGKPLYTYSAATPKSTPP